MSDRSGLSHRDRDGNARLARLRQLLPAETGFAWVTVVCEPAGHWWRVLDQLAAESGLALLSFAGRLLVLPPGGAAAVWRCSQRRVLRVKRGSQTLL